MALGRRKQAGEQLLVRFAEGSNLRARLEAVAKANNRTVTKEVIHRLEASLAEVDSQLGQTPAEAPRKINLQVLKIPGLEKRIESLEARIHALEAKG